MYILITQDEYGNNNDLKALITKQSKQYVNGECFIYGEITAPKFAKVSRGLAEGTYSVSDGEILPIAITNKK